MSEKLLKDKEEVLKALQTRPKLSLEEKMKETWEQLKLDRQRKSGNKKP